MIYAFLMCKNGDTAILEWPDPFPLEIRRPAKVKRDFTRDYWESPHGVPQQPRHDTQYFRAKMKDTEYRIVYYEEM